MARVKQENTLSSCAKAPQCSVMISCFATTIHSFTCEPIITNSGPAAGHLHLQPAQHSARAASWADQAYRGYTKGGQAGSGVCNCVLT